MTSLCRDTFDGDESDLDWCVDLNPALCAMTTAELRAAVASGKVGRATRVWRVGLEAWATLPEIPEFVGAFDAIEPEAPSETAATPLAVEIAPVPALDGGTDVGGARSPVVGRARVVPLVAVRARRSVMGRAREALFEARWIFAGAAVAAASIGLSLTGTPAPLDALEARTSVGRHVAAAVAGAATSLERRSSAADASVSAAKAPRAEVGQRRMRGSARPRVDGRGRAHDEGNAWARSSGGRRQNP